MTDDLSPEEDNRAELGAARVAAEGLARVAPPPIVTRKTSATAFRDGLTDVLAQVVAHIYREQIAPLQRRIAELEARTVIDFRGVWKVGNEYSKGDGVSHGGGLWICLKPTSTARPGDGAFWVLAVKRGAAA